MIWSIHACMHIHHHWLQTFSCYLRPSIVTLGRKELEKVVSKEEEAASKTSEENSQPHDGFSQKMCSIWNVLKFFFTEPPTNIYDCLHAFFDVSELKGKVRLM